MLGFWGSFLFACLRKHFENKELLVGYYDQFFSVLSSSNPSVVLNYKEYNIL